MKIVVYTLGCKVNQYESEGLIYNLKKQGHEVFTDLVYADMFILNSCAVTNEAEKKSRQTIAKFRALNKNAKIIVCGCASQKNSKQFEKLGVDVIIGNANKIKITDLKKEKGTYIEELPLHYNEEFLTEPSKTRAHIKIQDGCNNFCTYCIIPYLRGRSRSRDIISIIKEVDCLSKKVKEIVFTGINITDYKIDGKFAFNEIIEQIKPYKNIRFRLGSLERGIIEEDFIINLKNSNICPHFHMSLQSGSDSVLKRMNRKYTTEQFYNSIKLLRKHFKNLCITTDVIVGFPEETEKEFKETYNFVKKAKFYNIHIFPYSVRSGTVAEKMKQVDGNIKKERVKKLTKLNQKLNKNYIKKCINKEFTVLVEQYNGEYYIGHAENYLKCYIQEQCAINSFVKVKIQKQYNDGVIAKIIK